MNTISRFTRWVCEFTGVCSLMLLSACGGGGGGGTAPATYTIGGTVAGLTAGSQVGLSDNGSDSATVTANGAFTFPKALLSAATYAVTVATAPAGDACTVSGGTGTVVLADVTNITIVCNATHTIGGVVTGLNSGAQVALLDNRGDSLTVTANGSFTFATPVTSAYAVTIGAPPTGETCTVTQGSGTAPATNVTNVMVACAASVSAGIVLLNLGHARSLVNIQMSGSTALSEDSSGHWNLWDLTTDTPIESGTAGCLSSQCTASTSSPQFGLVALAGSTFVIETAAALEIRDPTDGHVLSTIAGPIAWWQLASDGSYVLTGSPTALQAWSPAGKSLYSIMGDYSKAIAYAASGQVQLALSPAGSSVIQTILLSTGSATTGPPFKGQFNEWFTDGTRFQTSVGTSVYTYLNTSVQQDLTTLPTVQSLAGQGNWFWIYDAATSQVSVYQVGASTVPAATYNGAAPLASAATLAVLSPSTSSQLTLVNLSGTTLTSSVHTLPILFATAYAATSPSQWLVGNEYGAVFDGTSSPASPKFLAVGAAMSIAGGGAVASIATASGQIFVINPQTNTIQNTVPFQSNKLEMSTDGTVLAAISDMGLGSSVQPSLQIYSLPSGTLTKSYGGTGPTYLFDYSLAGSGTVIAQTTAPYSGGNAGTATLQQVIDIPTGTVIWSSVNTNPVIFSPDGTLFAAFVNPMTAAGSANIYQNGSLAGAIQGTPVGWIDNGQLLTDNYVGNSGCNCFLYNGTAIYGPTGTSLSTPSLPMFTSIQTVAADTVYSNEYNSTYSTTTGAIVWTGTQPSQNSNFLGAVAGGYAVIQAGAQIVAEKY
jgi:hypothetical protein